MLRYTIPILLLAASGMQAQQCTTYTDRDVTIRLGKDSKADPEYACVKRGTRVRWISNSGHWSASFKDKSPFESGNMLVFNQKDKPSGWERVKECKGTKPECVFKYRSQVNPSQAIDPDVEVEPGQ